MTLHDPTWPCITLHYLSVQMTSSIESWYTKHWSLGMAQKLIGPSGSTTTATIDPPWVPKQSLQSADLSTTAPKWPTAMFGDTSIAWGCQCYLLPGCNASPNKLSLFFTGMCVSADFFWGGLQCQNIVEKKVGEIQNGIATAKYWGLRTSAASPTFTSAMQK